MLYLPHKLNRWVGESRIGSWNPNPIPTNAMLVPHADAVENIWQRRYDVWVANQDADDTADRVAFTPVSGVKTPLDPVVEYLLVERRFRYPTMTRLLCRVNFDRFGPAMGIPNFRPYRAKTDSVEERDVIYAALTPFLAQGFGDPDPQFDVYPDLPASPEFENYAVFAKEGITELNPYEPVYNQAAGVPYLITQHGLPDGRMLSQELAYFFSKQGSPRYTGRFKVPTRYPLDQIGYVNVLIPYNNPLFSDCYWLPQAIFTPSPAYQAQNRDRTWTSVTYHGPQLYLSTFSRDSDGNPSKVGDITPGFFPTIEILHPPDLGPDRIKSRVIPNTQGSVTEGGDYGLPDNFADLYTGKVIGQGALIIEGHVYLLAAFDMGGFQYLDRMLDEFVFTIGLVNRKLFPETDRSKLPAIGWYELAPQTADDGTEIYLKWTPTV